MQRPAPSHVIPGAHAVPAAANDVPQVPEVHVLDAQMVSVPGQFDEATHWTH
jgi:hypothetical protein